MGLRGERVGLRGGELKGLAQKEMADWLGLKVPGVESTWDG